MKKQEKRPDIHFRITDEKYQYLVAVAAAMDRSVSYLIEHIVNEWIDRHKSEEPSSK